MSKIRYYCDELDHPGAEDMCVNMPPSYEFGDEEDYDARLRRCRWLQKNDEAAYVKEGCHREAHMMVPGGRMQVRYPEEEFPGDKKCDKEGRRHKGRERSTASRERLESVAEPFDARTQSPKVRQYAGDPRPCARENPSRRAKSQAEADIRSAIARYRMVKHNQMGGEPEPWFKVPAPGDATYEEDVALLQRVGFPEGFLQVMLGRMAGVTFEDEVESDEAALSTIIGIALGGSLFRRDESLYLLPPSERASVLKASRFNRPLRDAWTAHFAQFGIPVLAIRIVNDKKDLSFVGPGGGAGAASFEDMAHTKEWAEARVKEPSLLFGAWLIDKIGDDGSWWRPETRLIFTFNTGGPAVFRPLSVTITPEEPERKLNYRRFHNLSVADLPALLVSIGSRRRWRAGGGSRRRLGRFNPQEIAMAESNSRFDLTHGRISSMLSNPRFNRALGQFGPEEEWTDGIQPVTRRNPDVMPKCNPSRQPRKPRKASRTEKASTSSARDPKLMKMGTAALVRMAKGSNAQAKKAADELRQRQRDPKTGKKR